MKTKMCLFFAILISVAAYADVDEEFRIRSLGVRRYVDREIERALQNQVPYAAPFPLNGYDIRMPICHRDTKMPLGYAFVKEAEDHLALRCVDGICLKNRSVLFFSHDSWLRLGSHQHSEDGMHCESLGFGETTPKNYVRISLDAREPALCVKPLLQLTLPLALKEVQNVSASIVLASAPKLLEGWLVAELRGLSDETGKWALASHKSEMIGDSYDGMSSLHIESVLTKSVSARLSIRLSEAGCRALQERAADSFINIFDAQIGAQMEAAARP